MSYHPLFAEGKKKKRKQLKKKEIMHISYARFLSRLLSVALNFEFLEA